MELRHEVKHEISYTDMLTIRHRLGAVACRDPHTINGKYLVRSLYFDNPDDKALMQKINGVSRREKFRIRYYNGDTSVIHLEKKSKYDRLGNKKTAPLTKEQAQSIVDGDMPQPPGDFDPENMPEDFDPNNMPQNPDQNNQSDSSASGDDSDSSNAQGNMAPPSDNQQQGENQNANQNTPQSDNMPNMMGDESATDLTSYILLGVSAVVLILGLGFAFKFRR